MKRLLSLADQFNDNVKGIIPGRGTQSLEVMMLAHLSTVLALSSRIFSLIKRAAARLL
ncbi:hypothetical protein OH492_16195 [Vibrio chagasii]|nr:hypothetical protein [Vibrio chagasii]